jgi:DNA-binding beta-propeller fold protein YncE
VNPKTNLVYVPLFFCSACGVVVIDGATNQITTTIPLAGNSLDAVEVRPLRNLVYVTDETAGLFVVNGGTNAVQGNVTGLNAPETLSVLPGTPLVVEADTGSNNAIFVNEDSLSVSRKVPVGNFPSGTAVNWPLRHVYVANTGSNSVSVIEY